MCKNWNSVRANAASKWLSDLSNCLAAGVLERCIRLHKLVEDQVSDIDKIIFLNPVIRVTLYFIFLFFLLFGQGYDI